MLAFIIYAFSIRVNYVERRVHVVKNHEQIVTIQSHAKFQNKLRIMLA